jgi:vacuolar-type H+-ATPase subunit I/STV1
LLARLEMEHKRKADSELKDQPQLKKQCCDPIKTVAIVTSEAYGEKPILVLMRKSTFDKYDPLLQLLEESYHVSDFSPLTKKQIAQLLSLTAVNEIMAEIEKAIAEYGFIVPDSDDEDYNEEEAIFDDDIDAVTLWFKVPYRSSQSNYDSSRPGKRTIHSTFERSGI